ncbi:MAG TPA: HPr family phosphocarrier protein [Candidatus Anaerobiospirillum stercoravium]|nr:HPr family phosphocarrier protein [Candidatus Anaerobiospirillum stercoravium]
MQQFTYTIKDRDGVHARPAGVIIKAAKAYKSKITIEAHGKSADLKGGIFALMGLGIRCGWDVVVTIEGEDENVAAVELQQVFAQTI